MTTRTLASELERCDPNNLADLLRQVRLDLVLDAVEHDTGTISGSATVTLPDPGALLVQSARVVTSDTAGSVGCYLAADHSATPFLPTAAGERPGVAALSVDGKTLTFPNTVTRVMVRYIPKPNADLTTEV